MARSNLTEADEGKKVVDADGNKIGMITAFRGGRAYVDPDPDLTDSIRSKLGWTEASEDDYPISEDRVQHITDDEVRLQGM